jgi:hypothetical protein
LGRAFLGRACFGQACFGQARFGQASCGRAWGATLWRRREGLVRDIKEKRRGLLAGAFVFTLYIQNSILGGVKRKGFWIYYLFACCKLGGFSQVQGLDKFGDNPGFGVTGPQILPYRIHPTAGNCPIR